MRKWAAEKEQRMGRGGVVSDSDWPPLQRTQRSPYQAFPFVFPHLFFTHYYIDLFPSRTLTLQERGCRGNGLWHAVLAVDGLQELWHAVVFVHNNHAHLQECRWHSGEGRRGGWERESDRERSVQVPSTNTRFWDGWTALLFTDRDPLVKSTLGYSREEDNILDFRYMQKNNGLFSGKEAMEGRKIHFFVFF